MAVQDGHDREKVALQEGLPELAETYALGRVRKYPRGSVLFWQGDPVDRIFIVCSGAVKISSVSEEGRVYTHEILGPDRLLGATQYLLGSVHEFTAECLGDSTLRIILPRELDATLKSNAGFSAAVMKELAKEAHNFSDKAETLRADSQSKCKDLPFKGENCESISIHFPPRKGVLS